MARPGFCCGGSRAVVRVTHLKTRDTPHTQASEEKSALGHRAQPWREEGFATWEERRRGEGRLCTEAEGGGTQDPGLKRTGKLGVLRVQMLRISGISAFSPGSPCSLLLGEPGEETLCAQLCPSLRCGLWAGEGWLGWRRACQICFWSGWGLFQRWVLENPPTWVGEGGLDSGPSSVTSELQLISLGSQIPCG